MSTELAAAQLGYFAGFFDGEGCVYLNWSSKIRLWQNRGAAYSIHCSVSNTYRPVLEEFSGAFGGTILEQIRNKEEAARRRATWVWRVSGATAAKFLTLVTPYLKEKRNRANAALFFCDTVSWPKVAPARLTKHGKRFGPCALSPEAIRLREIAVRGLLEHRNATRGGHRAAAG